MKECKREMFHRSLAFAKARLWQIHFGRVSESRDAKKSNVATADSNAHNTLKCYILHYHTLILQYLR